MRVCALSAYLAFAYYIGKDTFRIFSAQGIPPALRALSWQLLVGYLSPYKDRRRTILEEKRHTYQLTLVYVQFCAYYGGVTASCNTLLTSIDIMI